MSEWSTWLPIFLGGIATLAIYSFLVKENSFYRFFEHLYIGIATGFGLVFSVQRFIWPQLLRPMLGKDCNPFPNGEFDKPWRSWYLWYLLPVALGTLYYFIYSRKRQWLSRVVIAWSLGVAGGFALKGFFAEYMPQIIGSFKPLVAVETVERKLLVRFGGLEKKLPEDAEIVGGHIELYNLGPLFRQVVVKKAGGGFEELRGQVLRENAETGEVELQVSEQEKRTLKKDEIVLTKDLPPPPGTKDAYEGYGGSHQYKAYRLLEPGVRALAPVAESNAGIELLVRDDSTVRDVYRGQKWEVGNREPVGFKNIDLSADTLKTWFDRPESNLGIVLQRTGGAGGSLLHQFASSANPDQEVRPRLVIEYKQPNQEKTAKLVLQQGSDGYGEASDFSFVADPNLTPAAKAAMISTNITKGVQPLGPTATKPEGGLSVNWWGHSGTLANWIFMLTLICVMTYFIFSFEHSKPGIRQASQAGRWLMMLCFGAFFGSTIMARMALLVERLDFLIRDWFGLFFG